MEITDLVEYEHLPENMRYVCDIVGIDKTRELIKVLGPLTIDIPSSNQFVEAREKFVLAHFGKLSIPKIANKIGRSTKTVRRIITHLRSENKIKRDDKFLNPYKVKLTREKSFRAILEEMIEND